ncbi:hypothetical protein COY91_01215 [Candidatus Shapirobacteria bacterium CG_4_10_14_0_8_um_filter_39_15]|nr:MAG: hypothetical protein COY91_01215 [Candidatus Shapirobacteria bacterium CG_4_10_14_0_8_um_filter_39_15]PJE68241.1 MAG: hypothetical protein COU94_02845 [Candidatus Shapirobacteria bacterium CG10_big_fil_rev_8_21_14_0_10_38_8]
MEDEKISELAEKLKITLEEEQKKDFIDKTKEILKYPKVKLVLALLGVGSVVVLAVVAPGVGLAFKGASKILEDQSDKEWKKYNQGLLRRTLDRLNKRKMVEYDQQGDKVIVKLTEAGKKMILKYSLDNLEIKRPKIWDKQWRLIIYDVPYGKRRWADIFGRWLKNLGMYRIQKSVFLYPFPCDNEVQFLREYLGIGKHVWLMKVTKMENESVLKEYFGL